MPYAFRRFVLRMDGLHEVSPRHRHERSGPDAELHHGARRNAGGSAPDHGFEGPAGVEDLRRRCRRGHLARFHRQGRPFDADRHLLHPRKETHAFLQHLRQRADALHAAAHLVGHRPARLQQRAVLSRLAWLRAPAERFCQDAVLPYPARRPCADHRPRDRAAAHRAYRAVQALGRGAGYAAPFRRRPSPCPHRGRRQERRGGDDRSEAVDRRAHRPEDRAGPDPHPRHPPRRTRIADGPSGGADRPRLRRRHAGRAPRQADRLGHPRLPACRRPQGGRHGDTRSACRRLREGRKGHAAERPDSRAPEVQAAHRGADPSATRRSRSARISSSPATSMPTRVRPNGTA